MKTASLFFLGMVCLLSTTSNAQPYQPAAIEGAHWFMYLADGAEYHHHALVVRGDTMIDDQPYKKLYFQELANQNLTEPPYLRENEYLWGVIRDDTMARRVYAVSFESYFVPHFGFACQPNYPIEEEFLLHDFSAGIGDTIAVCPPYFEGSPWVLDSVFSTQIYGQNRRTLTEQSGYHPDLYEGIGSKYGLLAPPFQITYLNYGPEGFYIADYCIGADEDCGVVSNNEEVVRKKSLKVFPNPASKWVSFEWEQSLAIGLQLEILDHLGRQVLFTDIPDFQNKLELNVKALSKGMYFYQITDKKEVLGVGKLLIE
jgi:hypothetical protein